MNFLPTDCHANIFEFVSKDEELVQLCKVSNNFKLGFLMLCGRYNKIKKENYNTELFDYQNDPLSYFYIKFLCDKCDKFCLDESVLMTERCAECQKKKKTL